MKADREEAAMKVAEELTRPVTTMPQARR